MKIVNKKEITESSKRGTAMILIGMNALFCLLLVLYGDYNDVVRQQIVDIVSSILIIVSALGYFLGIFIKIFSPRTPTGKFRYEVLFEESDSILDIQDKYKVISQQGARWILEDRKATSEVYGSAPLDYDIEKDGYHKLIMGVKETGKGPKLCHRSVEDLYSIKCKEQNTGILIELNPRIDDEFWDRVYRDKFATGEFILVSGELPDKWKIKKNEVDS